MKNAIAAACAIAAAGALAGSALAAGGSASANAPFPMNPWPQEKVDYAFAVDTLTASHAKVLAFPICAEASVYKRGNGVVFQAVVYRSKDGHVMTGKDFSSMVVKIAGQPDLKLGFRPLGGKPDATSPWVWANEWQIPSDYPIGTVAYQIVAVTKKTSAQAGGQTVTWKPRISLSVSG
jgi:hypothetical protein